MSLPTGPDHVCFDTTALLAFAKVGRLEILQDWFPEAFAPAAVYSLELEDHVSWSAEARAIIEANWLQKVEVTDPADLAYIAYLREDRWKSEPGKDHGEAEVIVVARRYHWLAFMEDEEGRAAAKENGVPAAYMLEMMIAAAATGRMTVKEAWDLHVEVETQRRRALLAPDAVHRSAFEASAADFRQIWQNRGEPEWPGLLATPNLIDVILRQRRLNP